MALKKALLIILICFWMPRELRAVSPVTVTGTITDFGGNVAQFGTVSFTLQPQNQAIFWRVSGTNVLALPVTCGINGSGQLKNAALSGPCTVWGNDVISPNGSAYIVNEFPNNQQGPVFKNAQILGAGPVDLSNVTFLPNVNVMPDLSTFTLNPLQVSLIPGQDNLYSLGSSGDRFAQAYINNLFVNNYSTVSATAYNGVTQADTQTGATADIKLNACEVAAALVSGICDARGLYGVQTIAAEVDVLAGTELLLPQNGTWTVTITNGTSCGFKQFSQSSMIAPSSGGTSNMTIQAQASTNAASLWCNDTVPAGIYVRAEGFILYNPSGGTLANAGMDVSKIFDGSYFANLTVANYNGVGLYLGRNGLVCCGTTFNNVVINGNSGAGAVPLKVGASVTGVSFNGGSIDHPGAGLSNEVIDDGATGTTGPLNHNGVYYEGNTNAAETVPMIDIKNERGGANFNSVYVHPFTGGQTMYCFQIENVSLMPISIKNGSRCVGATDFNAINDLFASKTVVTSSTGNIGFIPDFVEDGSTAPLTSITNYYHNGITTAGGVSATGAVTSLATTNQLVIGASAHTDTLSFTAPAAANNTLTVPDAGGNASFSFAQVEDCGATSGGTQACAKTVLAIPIIVKGDVLLNTATTQSITTLPFTNANYSCSGSDLTTTAGTVFFNTYANASVTIGENGGANTDHLRYICVGN